LVNEAAGPAFQGRETRRIAILSGQEDEPRPGTDLLDCRHGVDARSVGATEIGENYVGLEFGRSGRRLSDGLRTSYDDHVRIGVEELGQAIGDDLMVFHDQDANPLAVHGRRQMPSVGLFWGSRPPLAKLPQFGTASERPA